MRNEVREAGRAGQRMTRDFQGVGNQLRALGPALSLAGLAAGINAATRYAEQVELIRASTGLLSDDIQRLSVVASRADLDLNNIDNITQRLAASTGEARRGVAEYAAAFDRLRIDANASLSDIIARLTSLDNITPEIVADVRRIGGRDAIRLTRAAATGGEVDIAPVSAANIAALTELRAAISDTSTSLGRLGTEGIATFAGFLTTIAQGVEAASEGLRRQDPQGIGLEAPGIDATLRDWSNTVDRWIAANEDIPEFIRDALLTELRIPLIEAQELNALIRGLRGLQLAPPAFRVGAAPTTPDAAVPLPPSDPANLRLATAQQTFRALQQGIDETAASLMAATIEGERFHSEFLPELIAGLDEQIAATNRLHNENVIRNHNLIQEASAYRELNRVIDQVRLAREAEIQSAENLGRAIGTALGRITDLESALQQIFGAVLGHVFGNLFDRVLGGNAASPLAPSLPPLIGPTGPLGFGGAADSVPGTVNQSVTIHVSGSDEAAVRRGIRRSLPQIQAAAKAAVAVDVSRPSALRSRLNNQ